MDKERRKVTAPITLQTNITRITGRETTVKPVSSDELLKRYPRDERVMRVIAELAEDPDAKFVVVGSRRTIRSIVRFNIGQVFLNRLNDIKNDSNQD